MNNGGIESWDWLELVLTVLAKLLGTNPGPEKDVGRGEGVGVGETPSHLPGDLESSLLPPGLSLSSSLGDLEPANWNLFSSAGVCLSGCGVSDLVVLGDMAPGVLTPDLVSWPCWTFQGNSPAPPVINDCSKFFLQDVTISSLDPGKLVCPKIIFFPIIFVTVHYVLRIHIKSFYFQIQLYFCVEHLSELKGIIKEKGY